MPPFIPPFIPHEPDPLWVVVTTASPDHGLVARDVHGPYACQDTAGWQAERLGWTHDDARVYRVVRDDA